MKNKSSAHDTQERRGGGGGGGAWLSVSLWTVVQRGLQKTINYQIRRARLFSSYSADSTAQGASDFFSKTKTTIHMSY